MKQKVSDYIADFLANAGIQDVFTIPGGLAMHMNDSFGHHDRLHCTYQHMEQACGFAAEAYARLSGRMAAVCVTGGPGAANMVTPAMAAYVSSIPMVILSGQVRYPTMARSMGVPLRNRGIQECDIVPVVESVTKYAALVERAEDIRYHLEKALFLAENGRPGPVWLDVPLDVQGAAVETEELRGFDPEETGPCRETSGTEETLQESASIEKTGSCRETQGIGEALKEGASNEKTGPWRETQGTWEALKESASIEQTGPCPSSCREEAPSGGKTIILRERPEIVRDVLLRLLAAERPVLFPGNGVRLAGAVEHFRAFARLLGIPVVRNTAALDVYPGVDPLFAGRTGGTGDRPGNFTVQNSDFILVIGSRMGYAQIGFNEKNWARAAFVCAVDIDRNELEKPGIRTDLRIVADAGEFLKAILKEGYARYADLNPFTGMAGMSAVPGMPGMAGMFGMPAAGRYNAWRRQVRWWRAKYPVVTEEHYKTLEEGRSNIYAFFNELGKALPADAILQVSVGTSRVVAGQVLAIGENQRLITNSNAAAMGFDLPAIVGLSRASEGQEIFCVTGEGSLMMNLQEFQTLSQNHMLFKLFIIDNEGYQSIRLTQTGFFGPNTVGTGPDSKDLSFPDPEGLAKLFGFAFFETGESDTLAPAIRKVIDCPGSCICRVKVSKLQKTLPKTASRRLPDGSMVSAPLEDMAPFLSREELKENMLIPLLPESLGE